MPYILFLDDERTTDMVNQAKWPQLSVVTARSTAEAIETVRAHGFPTFCSFDHDLGGADTTMEFLKWLAYEGDCPAPPPYVVHSQNPVGTKNIIAFMDSWERSLDL